MSAQLDAVVAKMLARKREDRYPNMRALARALMPFVADRRATERAIAAGLEVRSASRGLSSVVNESLTTVERTAA